MLHCEANACKKMLQETLDRVQGLTTLQERYNTTNDPKKNLVNPNRVRDVNEVLRVFKVDLAYADLMKGSKMRLMGKHAKVFRDKDFLVAFFAALGLRPYEADSTRGMEDGEWIWEKSDDGSIVFFKIISSWFAWAKLWGDEGMYI